MKQEHWLFKSDVQLLQLFVSVGLYKFRSRTSYNESEVHYMPAHLALQRKLYYRKQSVLLWIRELREHSMYND